MIIAMPEGSLAWTAWVTRTVSTSLRNRCFDALHLKPFQLPSSNRARFSGNVWSSRHGNRASNNG